MKRSNKKGFTIVELVIVIAIIAILAAVLIPTFASLIQKANESKDTQLVRNLNTALKTDGKEHKTMQDALDAAEAFGYDVGKINASATDNEILWDSVNDAFCYYNKDKGVEYLPQTELKDGKTPADYLLWKVYTTAPDTQTYSIYWNSDKDFNKDLTVGFDAGNNTAITALTYKGTAGNSVVIRTNGGKLTVNAASDHVEHYGLANEAYVQNVSDSTYVEHGIVGKMTVASGKKVVLKSTAVVGKLEGDGATAVTKETGAFVAGEDNIITVSTYEQLQGLALASTAGIEYKGKTIELANDIDLTGKSWQPFGFDKANPFSGTIDGKGHKIIGLSDGGYVGEIVTNKSVTSISGDHYGFIAYTTGEVTVKDITFENVNINSKTASVCAAVIGDTGDSKTTKLTLENITVNGKVSGKDKVAGLVGYVLSVKEVNISNCKVTADISATATEDNSYRAGGLFGFVSTSTVKVEKCTYNGSVKANSKAGYGSWCGLLTSGFAGGVNLTATDCQFSGTATTTNNDNSRVLGYTCNDQYLVGTVANGKTDKTVTEITATDGKISFDHTATK